MQIIAMRPTIFLLFVLFQLYSTNTEEDKAVYLKELSSLYDRLGLDGGKLAQRQVLMGLVSDALNAGKTLREERTVRDMEITKLGGEGSRFEAKILTHSLQRSFEYHLIRGSVDFARFELRLTSLERLDLASYPGRGRGILHNQQVNNGSRGNIMSHI